MVLFRRQAIISTKIDIVHPHIYVLPGINELINLSDCNCLRMHKYSSMDTHCKIALRWIPQNLTNEKLTLVQENGLVPSGNVHPDLYLSQCSPRSMLPYVVIMPQCVNVSFYISQRDCARWMMPSFIWNDGFIVYLMTEDNVAFLGPLLGLLLVVSLHKNLCSTLTHLTVVAVAQTIFSAAFSWMTFFVFWLRFHWSLFLRVQLHAINNNPALA